MKIILEGLKMKSEVIDCPDNLGRFYDIALQEPIQIANYNRGTPALPPLLTRARFEFSGYFEGNGIDIINSKGDVIGKEFPRIYRLVDIQKI